MAVVGFCCWNNVQCLLYLTDICFDLFVEVINGMTLVLVWSSGTVPSSNISTSSDRRKNRRKTAKPRASGIEPGSPEWQSGMLPLYHARFDSDSTFSRPFLKISKNLVGFLLRVREKRRLKMKSYFRNIERVFEFGARYPKTVSLLYPSFFTGLIFADWWLLIWGIPADIHHDSDSDSVIQSTNNSNLWKKQIELVPSRATKISRKYKNTFFPRIAKLVFFLCDEGKISRKTKGKEWFELKTPPS